MVDLHDRIAEAFADADGAGEDKYRSFSRRYAELLSSAKPRDPDLWKSLGAQIDVTVGDLESVPVPRRLASDEWTQSMTLVIAAARRQTFLEVLMPSLLDVRDQHTQRTLSAAKRMSRGELKSEATVPTATFRAAAERRKPKG
jgi:hypothetical protein